MGYSLLLVARSCYEVRRVAQLLLVRLLGHHLHLKQLLSLLLFNGDTLGIQLTQHVVILLFLTLDQVAHHQQLLLVLVVIG